jgi:tetratricopeptide (TPR) repeat protein
MKCLEKDRNRRYDTASSLARDVERYLHDEAVQACPPSAGYRLRKFVQRNRRALVTAAAVAGLLLAALAASAAWVWQERQEAIRQRDEAREQRRLARQAVDESFTLLSDTTLIYEPGLEPLRKQLLQAALRYYEGFVRQHGDDPTVQAELAAAYLRISMMVYVLGSDEDWVTPLEKGVAVMEDLMRQKPDVSSLHSLQAGVFRPLPVGTNYWKPAETRRICEKACAIWEGLVGDHPNVLGFQNDLAIFHVILGICQARLDDHAAAVRSQRLACDLWQRLITANPAAVHYRISFVLSLSFLSQNLTTLGQLPQAEEVERQAREITSKLLAEFPEVAAYQELDAWRWGGHALNRDNSGRFPEAVESCRQMVAAYDRLAKSFPAVPRYPGLALSSHGWLAEVLWVTGRVAEATEAYRQIRTLRSKLHAEDRDGQSNLAWFLVTCPVVEFRDGPRALEMARKLVERAPQNGDYWLDLGAAHYALGDWQAAVEALEKALQLSVSWPAQAEFLLAKAHWQKGAKDQARTWYDQAVARIKREKAQSAELTRFRAETAQLLEITNNNDK